MIRVTLLTEHVWDQRRGDGGRVPAALQDGEVQHAEGDQGAGQQEGIQEVLNFYCPVSPTHFSTPRYAVK